MSGPALEAVAELVRRESGILLSETQLPSLAAAIARAAPGLEPATLLRLAGGPSGDRRLVDRLIDEVTVKETFFFRHVDQLRSIDWRALTRGGHVRVWCAGCASGEEAYSLAILALEAFAPNVRPPVSILATDVARSALERAEAGRYGPRSVRNLEPEIRQRWFHEGPDRIEIGPRPRALVRFEHHNLVADPAPPAGEERFDRILCRNVLIYFDPVAAVRTVRALEGALRPGGMLLLGAADRLRVPAERGAARRRPDRAGPDERRRPAASTAGASAAPAEPGAGPQAAYMEGREHLRRGRPDSAVRALRLALYLDPSFAAAAVELGRAHEAAAGPGAARRAYWQALRLLEDARHGGALEPIEAADLVSSCRARLAALPPD